jgi:hypothetical protein
MGGKSSTASSAQTTTNYDQRQVNTWTVDDRDTTTNNSYSYDQSNRSTSFTDNSDRSFWQDQSIRVNDSSDRSTNFTDNSDRSFWQDQSIKVDDRSDHSQTLNFEDKSDRSNWQDYSIDVADSRDQSVRAYDYSDRSYSDSSDRSTTMNVSDSRQWYASDSSQRNTTTYNVTGSDAEAINKQNTAFLTDVGADMTDGMKTIAGFGFDALGRMGESATSLYATAGSNAVRQFEAGTKASTDAWAATVENSTGLISKLLAGAENTVNAARDISQQAITSYQPTENKAADVTKWGVIAAAVVAGVFLMRKA